MTRKVLVVGSYAVNCTILADGNRAYIVDPGQEAERILSALEESALEPQAILLTHAHFDHLSAVPALHARYPSLPVYLGSGDRPVINHQINARPPEYPPVDEISNLRSAFDLPALLPSVRVIDTPGHSPGGVCYYFAADRLLLSGDTLFAGTVGRTDLGGDPATLVESLAKLRELPDDTEVIPGHGMFTTIGDEKQYNIFMR